MTLATSVLIHKPFAVEMVMDFCNRELLRAEDPPRWEREIEPGIVCVANQAGLGLHAILDITYRPDGPIAAEYDAESYDEVAEGAGADEGSMIVGFDTAYGFGRGQDWSCNDLHAFFITRLAQEFGPVTWLNEYTGEWHRYEDGVDAAPLLGFGSPERGRLAVERG